MWGLKFCNFVHFCNTPDEWHAFCDGLLFPILLWPLLLLYSLIVMYIGGCMYEKDELCKAIRLEPHYIAAGIGLRCIILTVVFTVVFTIMRLGGVI